MKFLFIAAAFFLPSFAQGVLEGTRGDDTISCSKDGEMVIARAGNDVITVNANRNEVYGGPGIDFITIVGDDNMVDGGKNDDVITVTGNNNEVTGGFGDDKITVLSGFNNILNSNRRGKVIFNIAFSQFGRQSADQVKIMGLKPADTVSLEGFSCKAGLTGTVEVRDDKIDVLFNGFPRPKTIAKFMTRGKFTPTVEDLPPCLSQAS